MSNNQQVSTGEATPSPSQDDGGDRAESVERRARRGVDDSAGKRRRGQDFPRTRVPRRGYDCTQVEDFLHEAERAMRYAPPAMAPYEVQDARFRGVRFRQGYDMVAVDDRMEELHATLRDAHGWTRRGAPSRVTRACASTASPSGSTWAPRCWWC